MRFHQFTANRACWVCLMNSDGRNSNWSIKPSLEYTTLRIKEATTPSTLVLEQPLDPLKHKSTDVIQFSKGQRTGRQFRLHSSVKNGRYFRFEIIRNVHNVEDRRWENTELMKRLQQIASNWHQQHERSCKIRNTTRSTSSKLNASVINHLLNQTYQYPFALANSDEKFQTQKSEMHQPHASEEKLCDTNQSLKVVTGTWKQKYGFTFSEAASNIPFFILLPKLTRIM